MPARKTVASATPRPISDAAVFWAEVTSRGGLNPRRRNGEAGFDGGFEATVRMMLGIAEGRPIAAAIKKDKVTLEATVQAVLAAAAPWSRMTAASLKTPAELEAIGARLLAVVSKAGPGEAVSTLRQQALDIFDLPLWERRHELYSVWMAAVITGASKDPLQWVLTSGALDFSFGSSRLARFTPESPYGPRGETVLWSELRHPLKSPMGASRKNGVQPDYSVVAHGSGTTPVGLVVECKQYWKASKRNFRAALIDYARAHPDAAVLLANYGATPASITAELELDNPSQHVKAFGDVHPFGTGLALFIEAVKAGLETTADRAKTLTAHETRVAQAAADADVAEAGLRARSAWFASIIAEVEVQLSWASGGDLDLWAVPVEADEARAVSFSATGSPDWPPYAILDHDDRLAPGRETIKICSWNDDWLIKVHRHSGSWPDDAAKVEVRIGQATKTYMRHLTDTDERWWFVCRIDSGSKSIVDLDSMAPSGFTAPP